GQIVAHPDRPQLLTDGYAALPHLRDSRGDLPASLTALDTDQREWLYSYVAIPAADWIVAVQRATEVAFASPRALHTGLLIALGVFVIGGLFFWMMLSRRVIEPLERLAVFGRAIGQRDEPIAPRAPTAPELAHLLARADQMGHLTRALKRMEADIEQRFTELATLLETSTATSSSLDADRVINAILDQVRRLMNVDKCALVALDQREQVLRVRASRGLSEVYARDLRIDPHDERSPSMRAIRSGQLVQVPDTETDVAFESFRARARREGYRSLLAVPLAAPHIGPTALLVYRRDPHVFSHHEIELTRTFANHAAIALENALLFSRTDEQLQEQQRVIEAVIQSMSDGLLLHDANGTVLFANRGLADAIEAAPEELEGQPIDRVLVRMLPYALEPEMFQRLRADALAGRGPRTFEFTIKRDHRKRDIRARVFSVIDDDGRAIGQGELYQDITRYREVDRLKSALVSTVSHELRTPLAAIKGYASTLLQDDVEWDTVSVRQFAQVISAEADRLTQLVNDLLDMGRIEAGTLRLNKQVTALREVIENALAQITDGGAHTLNLDLPDDLPLLLIDARRIEVVVRNLVENAVKYAPAHTPIDIEARRAGDHVRVRVRDRGPGIAPEHRAHIFERFYRADDTLTRATGGAGLGLAICKGFVEAHGGSIELEDSASGVVLAFTLPIKN
ncbi:MAG: GAF domain-containing protein, partial [Chloroflexi bacterium]|nr:GAF domain-containing protein [Chloroflexota bacterium]